MGDVLGSIFGGGQDTSQEVTTDPTTQALNRLRLQQAGELFGGGGGLAGFARPGGDGAYTPSPAIAGLENYAYNAGNVRPELSFTDWLSRGTNRDLLNFGLGRGEQQLGRARDLTSADFQRAMADTSSAFSGIRGMNQGDYGDLFGVNRDVYGQTFGANRDIFNQVMSRGLDSASNYVNQIATPAIMQQMALAGLDSSGASAAAIAKASAEAGLPLMQSLLPAYMGEQASLGQNYMGTQGQLGQNFMGMQGALGQNYASAITDLMRTYGMTDASMLQSAMQGDRGLIQSYIPQEMSFLANAPSVASQYAMLPYQAGGVAAQTATSLLPLADYNRSLQQQDLLRRQGLATTAFTGLPYTPSTSTEQDVNQKPLFNFFGFG